MSAAKKLAFLNLQNNSLSQLPQQLSSVTGLRVLNLGFNGFQEIPSCIFQLQQLEVLLLTNNQVIFFPFLSFFFPLLHAHFLEQLTDLDVDSLANLVALNTLDVSNNSLSQLPPTLGRMTTLRNLQVQGNRFRVPRRDVIEKGTEAILAYLRDKIPL